MDSILKVVYDNWIPDTRVFLPNGIHPEITKESIKMMLENPTLSIHQIQDMIRSNTEGNPFRYDHSNFIGYYMKRFEKSNIVSPDDVTDDGSIYLLPIEIRTIPSDIYATHTIIYKGQRIKYSIIDTFSPKLLDLLKQGKVKVVFNLAHDPIDAMDQLYEIEKYFTKYGIDASNVIFIPANDCIEEYNNKYTAKLKISPCKFLIPQQAALDSTSLPRLTSLGYVSDIVRESDLDSTHVRPKRFVCFNRTMRPHRFMLAYLALKHDLLSNSIFSFLNGFDFTEEHIQNTLKEFVSDNSYKRYVKPIHDLIPYELDTQHLPVEQKSGFSSENTKKDWYESTYVHIVSETRFQYGTTPFISEKTVRPMANLQPFIMVNNYHSLRTLRDLGFKTFSPFIDESYDEETDYRKRMEKIEKEIVKLNNMPIQELHDWYYSITDVLLHNQKHLDTLAHIHPYAETYKDIEIFYKKETNGI